MRLSNLPLSLFATSFGAIGFSNTVFNGAALPASLDVLGAPGCNLYVSVDLEYVLANQSGFSLWDIAVPYDASILGLDAYAQGGVLAIGFNPANMVTSNAAHIVVGWF